MVIDEATNFIHKNTGVPTRSESERDYTYYWQLWHHNWDDTDIALMVEKCGLKGKRVLEVGCGDGRITFPLAKICGSIVGADLRDDLIEIAQNAVRMQGLDNIEFRKMDAQKLDFDDESFDAVLYPWVLQMVEDPAKAVEEGFRVLRRNGQMAVVGLLSGADYDEIIAKFLPEALPVDSIEPAKCYENPLSHVFGVDAKVLRAEQTFRYFFETPQLAYEAFVFALDRWYGGIKLSGDEQQRLRLELDKYRCDNRICIEFPAYVYFLQKG